MKSAHSPAAKSSAKPAAKPGGALAGGHAGPAVGHGAGGEDKGGVHKKLKSLDYEKGHELVAPGGADKGGGAHAKAASRSAATAPAAARPAAAVRHGMLKIGASGPEVSELQRELAGAGFSPGAVDGDFGPLTQHAVVAFQKARHLSPDGIAGPNTWGALGHAPAPGAGKGGGAQAAPGKGGGAPEAKGGKESQPHAQLVRLGSRGPDVKLLQTRLEKAGFEVGAIDGDFGAKTLGAVTAYQRSHHLDADGIVGKSTWASLGVAYSGVSQLPPQVGGGGHAPDGPPAPSSGDPIALARSFVHDPPKASHDMKGIIPNFTAAGGWTNNCADFVSAILESTGRIKGHHINVGEFERSLIAQGWHQVPYSKAQPGDVWINNSRGHTQLVSEGGGSMTIGSNNDRPMHQVINERPGYAAIVYHKNFA